MPASSSCSCAQAANALASKAYSSTRKDFSISLLLNKLENSSAGSIFALISLQNRANCLAVTFELFRAIAYILVKSFLTALGQSSTKRGKFIRLLKAVVKLRG